jgi:D-xylose transport system permease protein
METNAITVYLRQNIRTYAMIIALVAIWAIFTFATGGEFLTARNMSNLFRQMSITGVLAIGMVMVIIAGQIDLSVGSLLGLLGGIAAVLDVWQHLGGLASIIAAVIAGLLFGTINGWLVAYQKIPPFIATLGGYLAYRGMLIGITKGTTIASLDPIYSTIGDSYLPVWFGILFALAAVALIAWGMMSNLRLKQKYGIKTQSDFVMWLKISGIAAIITAFVLVMNTYNGIPVPVFIMLVLSGIVAFILSKTVFGRRIYAIGGNIEAARLSGINTRFLMMLLFTINGLMAAVAGILLTARLDAASVAAGQNAELDAIAACVIGGASLMGGIGSVGGALVGALVMASLDNGMSMLNTQTFWQYIVKGCILVAAVWIDIASKQKK